MNADIPGGHGPAADSEEAEAVPDGDFGDRQTPGRKLLLLSVGTILLGIFEDEIATIAEWRQPTPLPHAPPAVLGVVSIQGRMLTVLDPLPLLGKVPNNSGSTWSFLVALRGDEQLALAIERRVGTIAVSDLNPPPATTSRAVRGLLSHCDQLVNVVDVHELFPTAVRGGERRRRRF